MRLDELFTIQNGIPSSFVTVHSTNAGGFIPFLRPSSTQNRTVAGWLDPETLKTEWLYPRGTLFVSTDGEGSHSYAYVSSFNFVANSNVSILIPKIEMSLEMKIFYARCITMNRYKFSYGRKPKGKRLQAIELPDTAPTWLSKSSLVELQLSKSSSPIKGITPNIGTKCVFLSDLFDVRYGTSLELNKMARSATGINFVARTSKNNGVSAIIERLPDVEPIPGGVLTVAASGSVLETFYQEQPFYTGYHLFYLIPKTVMSRAQLLFYATCIRANQWKYSYGRQANRTLKLLPVPALDSIPDWVDSLYKTEFKLVHTNDSSEASVQD